MNAADLRAVLDGHWSRLAAAPVSDRNAVRTSALPVHTVQGPPLAAIDHDGLRHLLIPLGPRQRVSTAAVSTALRISERPLEDDEGYGRFADVVCTRRELGDVFTGLCRDVLVALEADGTRPYHTARAVVARWRRLFTGDHSGLTLEQSVGLFGELTVLLELLQEDAGAVHHWTGPDGHRHDFTDGRLAVEVKSTVDHSERRTVRVHGLDQLDGPDGGTLLLAWQRFETRPDGTTVGELVARAADLCDDEVVLLSKLAAVGYRPSGDHTGEPRFVPVESRWYHVDDAFPRLIVSSIRDGSVPEGVLEVGYTVDLAAVRSKPFETSAVADLLAALGES
ncbi:PD-(D/E)XK motif protein [Streptomyces sp. NPDC001380]|uniref:PD-(D/E)XK motif protein n=1 Tax=Streptomyces sp. NPDC001380 TaxID=3364566 RepID=UPI00369450EB